MDLIYVLHTNVALIKEAGGRIPLFQKPSEASYSIAEFQTLSSGSQG